MQADAKFWDGLAPKYAKTPIRDTDAYEYTLGRTRSYLKQSDHVLELGCGTASTALRLADSVAQIVASDISAGMLEQGRQRIAKAGVDNVTLFQAAPQTAPDGPFDVVMGFNLFHLVEDLDGAINEVSDRLKPGGLFISKTPCLKGEIKSFKFRMMKMAIPLMQFFGKAPFVRFFSATELEHAITRAGFQIIETGNYPVDPPNRYLVARKV